MGVMSMTTGTIRRSVVTQLSVYPAHKAPPSLPTLPRSRCFYLQDYRGFAQRKWLAPRRHLWHCLRQLRDRSQRPCQTSGNGGKIQYFGKVTLRRGQRPLVYSFTDVPSPRGVFWSSRVCGDDVIWCCLGASTTKSRAQPCVLSHMIP